MALDLNGKEDSVRNLASTKRLLMNETWHQIDNMLIELNAITTYDCSDVDSLVNIEQGIDCLNNLSNLFTSCQQ